MKPENPEIRRLRRAPSPDRGFLVCLGASLLITLAALTVVWLTDPGEPGGGFFLMGSPVGGSTGGDGPVVAVLGGTGGGSSRSAVDSGVTVGWHHRISGWVWADQVIQSNILGVLPRIGETLAAVDPDPTDGSTELFPMSEWYDPEGYCVMPDPRPTSRI